MIKQRIRQMAYKLELPSHMKIHDVFHISLLMPYKEMEAYGTPYSGSKNCPNVWLFCKDWSRTNQENQVIIFK